MRLKLWVTLLAVAAMLVSASLATAQATKGTRSKSTARQKKSTKPTPAPQSGQETKKAVDPETTVLPASEANKAKEEKAGAPPTEVERITVAELKAKLSAGEPVIVVDGRSAGSYDSSDKKIKGAIRIKNEDIESRMKDLPRDKEIVIYCA